MTAAERPSKGSAAAGDARGFSILRLLIGEAAPTHLPRRVEDRVRRTETRGEQMISLVHLLICAFLFSLYVVSPRAAGTAHPMFEPVPTALTVYGVMAILRTWLAFTNRLRPLVVALFVVFEILGLIALIFSFHFQYGQEPAFYLKAPTLGYLFVFIAVRAISFNPWMVLLAGTTAVLGWVGLLLFALFNEDQPGVITRSFVEYIHSSRILVGAEVDKMIALSTLTLVLFLALLRHRNILRFAAASANAAEGLKRFFDPALAEKIVALEELRTGVGELREATMMMIDLRGFSHLSESMRANELIRLLGEYQALVIPVVERNNGIIDKFMGDGVLAHFGAIESNDTHAADALRATRELLAAAARWRETRQVLGMAAPSLSIGLDTGEIMVGTIGHGARLEFTVIGEAVNRAAKLEAHTRMTDQLALTTSATAQLARRQGDDGDVAFLGAQQVRGFDEAIDICAVTSVRGSAAAESGVT